MTFASMRIRREIRKLSKNQWMRVVNAFWIMKTLSLDEGRAKYGINFVTYDVLVAKHGHAAHNPAGDQAHFSPIFPIFHRIWLLQLENSLIAIDPKIDGLPYWDIRESANKNSTIFSDYYLGSYQGSGPLREVVDGKFAFWPIYHVSMAKPSQTNKYNNFDPMEIPNVSVNLTENIPTTMNIFGFLRNPLSFNSAPHLTRNGWSICGVKVKIIIHDSVWDNCLQMSTSPDIAAWYTCIEATIHSPPHMGIAGSWFRTSKQVQNINCVSWFGHMAPPPHAKKVAGLAFPGSFISPYALGCFYRPRKCTKSHAVQGTVQTNTGMLRTINTCGFRPRAHYCGPLWTGIVSSEPNMSHYSACSSEEPQCNNMNLLTEWRNIQYMGDFGDPFGSPNDPIFPFHHANVDRHFQSWALKQLNLHKTVDQMNYFGFPKKGCAKGSNLNDIISATDPFIDVLMPYLDSHGVIHYPPQHVPITVKDAIKFTFDDALPYIYEDENHISSQVQRNMMSNSSYSPIYSTFNLLIIIISLYVLLKY